MDLFWPSPVRLVTPGNRNWRIQVGSKAEMILLAVLLSLTVALYPLSHLGFRDALQALLKSFDIAVEVTVHIPYWGKGARGSPARRSAMARSRVRQGDAGDAGGFGRDILENACCSGVTAPVGCPSSP